MRGWQYISDDTTRRQQEHESGVPAWWSSGRTGLAKSNSALHAIHFTALLEFGGLEADGRPKNCFSTSRYTTTFRMIAGYAKFSFSDLEVAVGGVIQKLNSGRGFRELTIPPKLTIFRQDDRERAIDLLNRDQAAMPGCACRAEV
jgi:hypothetical protein